MRLLTPEEVKSAEQAAVAAGITEMDLMNRAGTEIAELIDLEFEDSGHVLILAGPGNNGGDGIVIGARLLALGWAVSIWLFSRTGIENTPVTEADVDQVNWITDKRTFDDALADTDLVVDAVFGSSGRAELPDDVANRFAELENERTHRSLPIIAVDMPSGVDATTGEIDERTLATDVTAMIGFPKIGCFRLPAASLNGQIFLLDIGLTDHASEAENSPTLITDRLVRSLLPARVPGAHKRSVGTTMVVGGAPQFIGAPRLAGEAALRAGSGLVTVAASSAIVNAIATAIPELTFLSLPSGEHSTAASRMASIVHEKIDEYDSLIVGPGLGTDAPTPDFLAQLFGLEQPGRSGIGFGSFDAPTKVEPFGRKAVIDADGLNWLASRGDDWVEPLKNAKLVLTPHSGELSRLLGKERDEIEADPWSAAQKAAQQFQQVVVLKYAHSVVATPNGELYVAADANPGLATAGTGDVLAGTIGALLAQGLDPSSAAIAGVGIGLRAAEIAAVEVGSIGFTASDVISRLPAARDEILQARSDFD
jgi:ADP-dependent NAD(P)H-hydrate dehydratase / NAD(P)H-hydrate epimerase